MAKKAKKARKKRAAAQKPGNGANLGFEATLCTAADKMRGHMDPGEYKHVVLGLIFLKYISDAFEEVHARLAAEDYADPEDRDEYMAENVFWVPKEARWPRLQDNAKQPTIGKLLDAARRRPIAMLARKTVPLPEEDKVGRSSWTYEAVTGKNLGRCYRDGLNRLQGDPKRRAKLEQLGRERALFHLLAVSTGLRRKELASLTIGRLHLDAVPTPFLELHAADAKNAKAANLPLRADVVAEVKRHLADRQSGLDSPPLDAKLFTRPPAIRIFDADLQAAGIPKYDQRGRVVDIHALRHTFGTHLSAAGVHPRTAMAAMRHSRIELTMNLYTDPVLLDVAGAVEALPSFDGQSEAAAAAAGA